jgi:hypothetical protein
VSSIGKHPRSLNFSDTVDEVLIFPKYFQVYERSVFDPSTFTEGDASSVVVSDRFIT